MKNNFDIKLFPKAHDLFQYAAKDFSQRVKSGLRTKDKFSVVLAGGNTPKLFFDTLTRDYKNNIPWANIQFFFGDERYVAADNLVSNYHMAYKCLFSKLPINFENVYKIPTQFADPNDAAKNYEETLRAVFQIKDKSFPLFDLVYLGLGDNAHTASLMPLSTIVKEYSDNSNAHKHDQLVVALFVPEANMYRISLTPSAINHAKNIIFMVTGNNKATAVSQVLEGKYNPLHYPAQLIHCLHNKTMWYLDDTAAQKLSSKLRTTQANRG